MGVRALSRWLYQLDGSIVDAVIHRPVQHKLNIPDELLLKTGPVCCLGQSRWMTFPRRPCWCSVAADFGVC